MGADLTAIDCLRAWCCCVISVSLFFVIQVLCNQAAVRWPLITRPVQLYLFPALLCKSTMTTTPRVPLNLHDHIELLRAVRESISYDCFRTGLKITGLSMYLPEGRRRRYKGKPVLPTLVLQTDSSRCLNLRGAVLDHPQPNTTYFTVTAENIYQKCWDRAIAAGGRRVCMNCKDMHLRIGRPNERLLDLMGQLLLTHKRGVAAQSRSTRCRKRPTQTALKTTYVTSRSD